VNLCTIYTLLKSTDSRPSFSADSRPIGLPIFTSTQRASQGGALQSFKVKVKVIEIGTNQKPMCDFLLLLRYNCVPIFYRFRDITIYWSKICNFRRSFLPTAVSLETLARNVPRDLGYESSPQNSSVSRTPGCVNRVILRTLSSCGIGL